MYNANLVIYDQYLYNYNINYDNFLRLILSSNGHPVKPTNSPFHNYHESNSNLHNESNLRLYLPISFMVAIPIKFNKFSISIYPHT